MLLPEKLLLDRKRATFICIIGESPKPNCLVGAEFTTRPQPKRHKWMSSISEGLEVFDAELAGACEALEMSTVGNGQTGPVVRIFL